MTTEMGLEAYFSESASWDLDRAAQSHRSARRAWIVASLGCVCSVLLCGAVILMMPLKRVEPFLVRVDNATGGVEVVPVYVGHEKLPEAVARYFLGHYVTVCERFNFSTAESDYSECGAFQTTQRNQAWYALWNPSNPASPLNLYKDGTTVQARVISISFFTRANGAADLAQVRYVKAKTASGGTQEELSYWIATIQYAFAEPARDPAVRRWNPLGFKVLDFRPEPETVGEPRTPARSDGGAP